MESTFFFRLTCHFTNSPMRTGIALCVAAALCFNGCESASTRDLEGTYSFRTEELQETLKLKDDGTFTQEITIDGRKFSSAGEWVIEKPNRIKLRDFLVRFDTFSGKIVEPPQKYGAYIGFWSPRKKCIEFDEGNKYFLNQVTPK